ncbi:MAG: superoxide dismutase [Ni] [Candidatus Anammoxibacter sp.]
MKKSFIYSGIFILLIACISCKVWAHCEIPCGIYGDDARFAGMAEDLNTIGKSMNKIIELSKDPKANINQLVRWVQNKEIHADKINEVVTKYFLKQRVKPVTKSNKGEYKDYTNKLALLHQIMVHSMKAKQTTDLEHVKQMSSLLEEFHKAYHPDEFKR